MCGIAGIAHSGATQLRQQRERVFEMTRRLAHRGPDGFGLWHAEFAPGAEVATTVTLGHRRLAILDLSEAGAQPMTSACGRWTIVFNGEIFNYLELRKELECAGRRFRTATDTEVLLECCAARGIERTLPRLIGMFAFALWDSLEGELLLARDRVGEKPLVYFRADKTLAFASEVRALAEFHGGALDPDAVEVYLALGYVPAPLGIFRHTAKLAPGHWAKWKRGSLEVRRWWFPEAAGSESGFAFGGELRELIGDAVRLRLRSDVPTALSLSGGIDSSVVASELAHSDAAPHAFTVVFNDDETDLRYARSVARRFGLRHEMIRAESEGPAQSLDAMVRAYDEPFADSSAIPSLALARALEGRYKVVLNGDGGDEAFAGYPHYEYIAAKQFLKRAAARVGMCDGSSALGVYVQSKATFKRSERRRLLNGHGTPEALDTLLGADEFLRVQPAGSLQRALWTDRHLYLSNDLTHKMDVALGSAGIEGRAPLLDHRILERAQRIQPPDLVRGRTKKLLLRRAYRDTLPAEILDRPKHGFGSPVAAWLDGPLQAVLRKSLPCPLLDAPAQSGARGQRLWTLLVFARWAQTWRARW